MIEINGVQYSFHEIELARWELELEDIESDGTDSYLKLLEITLKKLRRSHA